MMRLHIIRDIAKEKKITLKELSLRLGMTADGLQKLINRNSTTPETIGKIAEILDVPVILFFDDDKAENTVNEESEVDTYNNNSSLKSILKEKDMEIEHLKKMLEEKERTIQILLKK